MPQVGDLLRYTQCGTILGEEACNVLYVVVSVWTGNTTLEAALQAASDTFLSSVIELQVDDFTWTRFVFDNLTDGVESAEYVPLSGNIGLSASEAMPPFASYSFRQNRASKLTRNGYKRVGGVPEINQNGGELTLQAGPAAAATDVENFYSLPIGSGDFQFEPVIAGRLPTGGIDFARINSIASCELQNDVSTQNTRKFGRGS